MNVKELYHDIDFVAMETTNQESQVCLFRDIFLNNKYDNQRIVSLYLRGYLPPTARKVYDF